MCEKGVDGVLCVAQTHKCPKEGSNRSAQNFRFQGRGLLTIDPCLISKILLRVELGHRASLEFVVVRCGGVCVKKAWMVCCAVPKRTNAQRRVRTAVSRIFDSRDVAYEPLTHASF